MRTCGAILKEGLMPGPGRGTQAILYCPAEADDSGYCPVHRPVAARPEPALVPSSVLDHPDLPLLESLARVQLYGRDGNGRHRLEVGTPASGRALETLLRITVGCATCRRPIHPVRMRKVLRRPTLCLNVSCELDVCKGCARSAAAHAEYERIAQYLLARGKGTTARHDRDVLPWSDADRAVFGKNDDH